MTSLSDITRFGIIAIIRSPSADSALATAGALFRGGILAVEVTYSTPDCCGVIAKMCAMAPAGAAIGVGTVRSIPELTAAVAAGATYAVCPHVDVDIIAAAKAMKVGILPGAFTASEVVTAWNAGATCIKLFPAVSIAGPEYLRALRAPLNTIPFMPTGGVSKDTMHEWFAAGAVAVGIGGKLTNGPPDQIEALARSTVARLAEIRSAPAKA